MRFPRKFSELFAIAEEVDSVAFNKLFLVLSMKLFWCLLKLCMVPHCD